MTQARGTLVSLADTPYYHCITRCVRRAFLCGRDPITQKSFDHRKVWLVERFKFLASLFAVDICAYAVMSNHYHLVLYVNVDKADRWSDDEVMQRWKALFPVSAQNLEERLAAAESQVAQDHLRQIIQEWRDRLKNISWFMKCLNEYIARRCNGEDTCKGHFWEARFKSQALLDETALLTCMAYVDLNPVRAAIATTPEGSDFTSIQERIVEYAKALKNHHRSNRQKRLLNHYHHYYETQYENKKIVSKSILKPLGGSAHIPLSVALPFTRQDYFQLVDYSGRVIREDKRGAIPERFPDILTRMGIETKSWLDSIQEFTRRYGYVAGSLKEMKAYEQRAGKTGVKGISMAREIGVRQAA